MTRRAKSRTSAGARSTSKKSRANGTISQRMARSGFGVTKVKKSKS